MAVTKTISIDGTEVTFRASAAIPRLYRNKFHRDIYKDLNELQKGIDAKATAESSSLDTFSPWSCSRISLGSWQSTRIRRFRILRRNGSTSSTPSRSTRFFLRSSNCGD
jgi:hypothetical protein